MTDAPERIRVAQDAEGFWTCREAVSGSQEYVRADLYAALEAKIAEKDKEIAELREAVEPFSRLASVLRVGDADDTIVIGVSAGDLRRLVNASCVREGRKIDRAAMRCEHCAGSGRVFVCRHWPRCHCADGVIESDCPGHSVTCPECGGKGNAQPVASTNPA